MQTLWDELNEISPEFVTLCQQIYLTDAAQIAELVGLLIRHPFLWPAGVSAETLNRILALLPDTKPGPHLPRTLGVPCCTPPKF